jgi:hypothetical protein
LHAEPSAREKALANERIPVNALHLEAQWGVDCSSAIAQARAMAEPGAARSTTTGATMVIEALRPALRHCGFIYNTPGTQTYRACPDFKLWEAWLGGDSSTPTGCD